MIIVVLPYMLWGQNYLSEEKEFEIKMSGKYYWDECSDFKEDDAKQCAFSFLSTRIVEDTFSQSRKTDRMPKTIETGVHFDRLQQKGYKIKILAWIAKDSVFVNTTYVVPGSALQELVVCEKRKDIIRLVRKYGFVRGSKDGFANPEKCIIAVFAADETLSALLDVGDSSRVDLRSGDTIQHYEQYYNQKELLYIQLQKIINK